MIHSINLFVLKYTFLTTAITTTNKNKNIKNIINNSHMYLFISSITLLPTLTHLTATRNNPSSLKTLFPFLYFTFNETISTFIFI